MGDLPEAGRQRRAFACRRWRVASRHAQPELRSAFSFLDIACGDASQTRVLAGTKVHHYHGVDLSEPALELAANNLRDMPFEVELDHRDFVEAVTRPA